MARIISFANQKGGVGKTTSAVNVAAALGYIGKKVLLVDTDPQGNCSSGVGVASKQGLVTTYDLLCGNASAEQAVISTPFSNLWIIPASVDLAAAELSLADAKSRESVLKKALQPIVSGFDYIIMDLPPSLGLISINALTASDAVIVPMQCEYFALEGLSQLVSTINHIKKLYNPSLSIEGVILTMYDGRLNLSIAVASEIKKYFPDKVFRSAVPRNVKLSEAPSHGKPIIYYDKYSKGGQSYLEIAKELITRI